MENESEKELIVAESIDAEEESVEENARESEELEFTDANESGEEENPELESNDSHGEEDPESGKNSNAKPKEQSKEERAMYASVRKEVENSVEKKHKESLSRAYQKGRLEAYKGKINPYTNTEIKDTTDIEVYEDMYKIATNGGDPLKDYASYAADKKREEAREQQEQAERETKAKQEIEDFNKKYPNVNLKDLLNNEQFKDYADGKNKSLVDVYDSYMKFTTAFRNKGIETAKKTIANTISSPGSLSSSSDNVVDYATMSKEEFEREVAKVKEGI